MSGSTVLIVDDERTLARANRTFMTEAGYEAEVAGDAEQALELLETLRPDVVFTDVRLPGISGIDLLRRVREFDPAIPVIIMTAYADLDRAVAFYRDTMGFDLQAQLGDQAAFLSAGGSHHHIGLNTWESKGGHPPPPGTTGLFHTAILYPTRRRWRMRCIA